MAGNSEKISTYEVTQIANEMDTLNSQLRQQLENSKSDINSLSNVWSGEASASTIAAFNAFATKYFDNYEKMVKQYTDFLRQQISALYEQVETDNKNLGDSFK